MKFYLDYSSYFAKLPSDQIIFWQFLCKKSLLHIFSCLFFKFMLKRPIIHQEKKSP